MEQSDAVTLQYHPANNSRSAYRDGNLHGREMKFCRVFAGVALPRLEGQLGVIIVLGELDRASQPMDLTGLGAAVGSLAEIENALTQFLTDLKPETILVENEPSRKIVWQLTDHLKGAKPLPLCFPAPELALTEVGRQNVDTLIGEGRLHIEHLLPILDVDKEQTAKALRFVVTYALGSPALYPGPKRGPLKLQRIIGGDL